MNYFLQNADGQKWKLPAPVSVSLQKDEDAPAAGLQAVFPAWEDVPCAAFFRVEEIDGTVWFDGVVDTLMQTDGAARLLKLTARSRAALLLDSEALPCLYARPSLPQLIRDHAVPYGFAGAAGCTDIFEVPYTVEKGISEWQVLAEFCQNYLGQTLREMDGVLTAEAQNGGEALLLGGKGIPYMQVCEQRNFYRGLSEIWEYNNGIWKKRAQDSFVQQLGLLRCRRTTDAAALLQTAQKAMLSVTVLCAGWVRAQTGQKAVLNHRGKTRELRIGQVLYSLSASGKTTRFLLYAQEKGELQCGC
ncbi:MULTISPECIES: hypothetical protein [Caproicibacterium]|uniref:Uncharacterized protein n=1 Tax=Caproicibacterium argilliputei TaxID=3030016 RepID=A0AA97D891_9FIRM|nr:hypothetical protein [Caproicibacterium argilliputei]WOC32149.1 hypothetical protein PXC00_13315 [Caproicibacterium argilliputei]